MGKKGNFAGWFRPSLQKARNGRVETCAAHSAYSIKSLMANVFRLASVDCGETGQQRAGEKSAGK